MKLDNPRNTNYENKHCSGKHVCKCPKSEMYPVLNKFQLSTTTCKSTLTQLSKGPWCLYFISQFIQNQYINTPPNLIPASSHKTPGIRSKNLKDKQKTSHKLNQWNDLVFYFTKEEDDIKLLGSLHIKFTGWP